MIPLRFLALPVLLAFVITAWRGADDIVLTVAPGRRDDGSRGPYASLNRAVEIARERSAASPGSRIRIVLRGGSYFLDQPVRLGPRDSRLTIEAARGAKPVIYGGRKLRDWQRDGERLWSAALDAGADGIRLLVMDGSIRPRARLPEAGSYTHLTEFNVPWMSTTGGGWKRKPTEAELTTLRYRPDDLGPWLDLDSAELTVYHMWDESVVGLKAHDPATQTLTFATPAGHPPGAFGVKKYVIWNVKEGLTRPGQWYFDRKARRIGYWPLPGERMDRVEALVPSVESIIRIQGTASEPVTGITLRGIRFSVANTPLKAGGFGAGAFDGALSLSHTRDCRIEDVTIQNVAGQGIRADRSDGLHIDRCDIHDTGACGVKAGGANMVIADNRIHHIGRLYPSGIALWIAGPRALAEHNEIHDTPYSAIVCGGDEARIEWNLIYRAMQELHDGGGIYVSFCKRVTLRGNVIRDIEDTGGYGSSAYYLDEQAEDCVVEGNLSVNVARPSHNHMARNNVLRGNIFLVNGDARLTFPRCSGYTLDGNIISASGKILVQAPPDGIRSMPRNVIFSTAGRVEMETLAEYTGKALSALEPREGTIFADPGFRNPSRGDYRFRPDSPAAALGILPIDPESAGPRGIRSGRT